MRRFLQIKPLIAANLAAALGGILVLGFVPVPADPSVDPNDYNVGARYALEPDSGITADWPPVNFPSENLPSSAQRELGYLLFFDPVLSKNNDMSCATCHHPDLGFADGRSFAMGAGGDGIGPDRTGGAELARSTPSLWNIGFGKTFFWDGRAPSLEAQALGPLLAENEMAADPDELVAELRAIPEYAQRFADVYPNDAEQITVENVVRALANFERALLSNDSPFDRYLAGERWALTVQQRRGMALFRSGQTNCSRCHVPPTFTEPTFRRVAVPDLDGGFSDPGRMLATEYIADEFAFKVPTLRNIALTAPYMHNGRFESLEAVIDFYSQGGGPGLVDDAPGTDVWVRGFEISDDEVADLVAFLFALTDESARPRIPESVPSGLALPVPIENPARDIVAAGISPAIADSASQREQTTLVVAQGESIQAVIDRAIPGDRIEIEYGIYSEALIVDLNDITLRGLPNIAGEWPVLDGRNELREGILASGNNFTVEKLRIADYIYNGAIVQGAENVTFRDLDVSGAFQGYGLYSLQNSAALFERVTVSGARGAGIYAGQSDGVVVRDSTVHANVVGIELENSVNVEVYGSHIFDNTTGVFVAMLPYLTSQASDNTEIFDNVIEANNRLNFAGSSAGAGFAPTGGGVLVLASDDVHVHDNMIRENDSFGVGVFGTASGVRPDVAQFDQNAEGVRVIDNDIGDNGRAPDYLIGELGLRGADLVWDARNWDAAWRERGRGVTSDPVLLPDIGWPDFLRRAYWRLLSFFQSPAERDASNRSTEVTIEYAASIEPDANMAVLFPECVRAAGQTHVHASWTAYDVSAMIAVDSDRWEVTLPGAPVGVWLRIRVNDPNACDRDPNGAVTVGVSIGGVSLERVVDTPGNGIEPGLAFRVDASETIQP